MATIAFVVHHDRPGAAALAAETAAWLIERGHDVRLLEGDAAAVALEHLGRPVAELLPGLDLVVSLGGDGTMLRAVDLVAPSGVPVLGVNFGQLGYLTQVEPEGLRVALKRFLAGSFAIEERMMLAVEVDSASGDLAPGPFSALNEAVVEKTPMGHTVRLGVAIDGEPFTTYAADGLIVATPTGSTAYAFSARGPIVAPTHRAILLTPVSPHMLFDRTLVLEPTTTVTVEVMAERPATVSVDGRNLGVLRVGDLVRCTASDQRARVVTFRPRDFHRILKTKFGLEDR